MSKNSDYETGQQDGRNGFMAHSGDSDYQRGWWDGKQEYDYWNDKELYPSLSHNNDAGSQSLVSGDEKIGAGSIFVAVFVWLAILAPFALFFSWEDWIVQVIFWSGAVIVVLVFIIWLLDAIDEEKRKKSKN